MQEGSVTVGELVAGRPGRSRVFERLGIDYCCGGRKPLAQACREKGLDLAVVVRELEAEDARGAGPEGELDLLAMRMGELADHIEQTHHAWLRTELPRIAALLNKVADAHGGRDPRLVELRKTFEAFAYELFTHMQKEERVLFPVLRQLEQGGIAAEQLGWIDGPINAMTQEHDEAGAALAAMRSLTDEFALPEGICNTHRAAIHALKSLESDMHQHVHKENNILFPQARKAAGLT